jgi:hypothetical protein
MTDHTNRKSAHAPHLAPVTPGRRGVLGGAAALLAGAAAVALPRAAHAADAGSDAALIAMCTEFCECERTYRVIYDDPARVTTDDEAEVFGAPVLKRMNWLSSSIMGSRAHTPGGIVAIATALAVHNGEGVFSTDPDPEHITGRLSLTLMRETLRLHGLPVPGALLDVAVVPAAPVTAPTLVYVSPDAELIRLCDRVVANQAEWLALINSRHTAEDEERTEPDNDRLLAERHALLNQIEAAPDLSTRAGAVAMARAALADAPLGMGGHWEAQEDYGWLALTVAEYMVREGVE